MRLDSLGFLLLLRSRLETPANPMGGNVGCSTNLTRATATISKWGDIARAEASAVRILREESETRIGQHHYGSAFISPKPAPPQRYMPTKPLILRRHHARVVSMCKLRMLE